MRGAPAVTVQGRGGWAWAGLQAGLPALAAAAPVAWFAALAGQGRAAQVAAALAAGLGLGGWCLRAWRRRPATQLTWDGQAWTADGLPGTLQLMADLGFLLLLRLHAQGGRRRWLAISAAEAGPAWHALRCAVYSRPPRATPGVLTPERSPD